MRLTKEDRSALADAGIGLALNLAFLVVCVIVLLSLGKGPAAWVLTKANVLFCLVLTLLTFLTGLVHRYLRIDDDTHFRTYLYSNAAVAVTLVAGWSAFVAVGVRGWAVDVPLWKAAVLYLVGLISSYSGYTVVAGYYGGSFYRLVNLPIAFGSLLFFALWPAAGWAIFGWVFALFGFQR
jgi:hypothetical protein